MCHRDYTLVKWNESKLNGWWGPCIITNKELCYCIMRDGQKVNNYIFSASTTDFEEKQESLQIFPKMVPNCSVSMCVYHFVCYACPSLSVIEAWAYLHIVVTGTTMGKSDWLQQWLHSIWPRLQAPGLRGTGDSKQATVGCLSWGYTTAWVSVVLFFFLSTWGEDCSETEAQKGFGKRQILNRF